MDLDIKWTLDLDIRTPRKFSKNFIGPLPMKMTNPMRKFFAYKMIGGYPSRDLGIFGFRSGHADVARKVWCCVNSCPATSAYPNRKFLSLGRDSIYHLIGENFSHRISSNYGRGLTKKFFPVRGTPYVQVHVQSNVQVHVHIDLHRQRQRRFTRGLPTP
jgi:hypothetical protein